MAQTFAGGLTAADAIGTDFESAHRDGFWTESSEAWRQQVRLMFCR